MEKEGIKSDKLPLFFNLRNITFIGDDWQMRCYKTFRHSIYAFKISPLISKALQQSYYKLSFLNSGANVRWKTYSLGKILRKIKILSCVKFKWQKMEIEIKGSELI